MSGQEQFPNAGKTTLPKGPMRSKNSLRISVILILAVVCLAIVCPVPRSLLAGILNPLTDLATTVGVSCLHALGVPAVREGDQIHLWNQSVAITLVDAGLRQTIGFLACVAVAIGVVLMPWWQRLVIAVSALFIAPFILFLGTTFYITATCLARNAGIADGTMLSVLRNVPGWGLVLFAGAFLCLELLVLRLVVRLARYLLGVSDCR